MRDPLGGHTNLGMPQIRVKADFNGVFGDLLCISHTDTCVDERGAVVRLRGGLLLTAYEDDQDETGRPDKLLATGVVEPSPDWLNVMAPGGSYASIIGGCITNLILQVRNAGLSPSPSAA